MALMTYLLRDRHSTYYFRRVIPKALRPFMPPPWQGKTTWKESLRTKLPAEAKRLAARRLAQCMADFASAERARRGEPSATRINAALNLEELEADTLAELLAADEAERSMGDDRRHLQTEADRESWPDLVPVAFDGRGMAEDHHHAYGLAVDELSDEYRAALSRSNPGIVDAECRAALRRRGVPIDPTSETYHAAGLAVLRAHVRAFRLMQDRQRGEVVATPAPSAGRGPTLSEAFADWKAGSAARGSRKPAANTVAEASLAVRRLTEWCGDLRLGELTREKAREFRDAVARVPTRLSAELRRLPLRDLLARNVAGYPPAHAATVNKHLTLLSAIVAHAEAAGKLDGVAGFRNPFGKGVKLAVDERAAEPRQPFSAADLSAIFGTPVFRSGERPAGGGGEAAFFMPLLALLSGARQAELAQLRLADLARDPETGVWYLDIGTAGGRSIKTATSRRRVPVHPDLERIGLLRYREARLQAGATPAAPLFPDVKADLAGRQSGPWSKWFNRYLRDKAGIEDRTKVFHSFRHTFKRLARDAKLPEEVHDALTGHAGGGVGRDYGQGFGLAALGEHLARIVAPAALAGLEWMPPAAQRRPDAGRGSASRPGIDG